MVDWDAKTTIAAAKVYVKQPGGIILDSSTSNANGRVSFRYKKEGAQKFLTPVKVNYLFPQYLYFVPTTYSDRTDTLYLVKPSFVNVTTHKSGTYLPTDSVGIKVFGDYIPSVGQSNSYRTLARDKADALDKIFNLQAVYGSSQSINVVAYLKLYFQWEIIRGGTVISTLTDSTALIQFGTKNHTINY